MAKVFLIEQPRHNIDLSTAKEFGDLNLLFPAGQARTSVFSCHSFGEEVISRLGELGFDHNADAICVAGSMVTITVAVIAAVVEYGAVNLLFFNATANRYVVRRLGEQHN